MKIGTDQYNTFDTMTMDCWNDRVYYEGKEFPAGQFAAEILNFAGEIHDPLLERITVLTALVDDLSTAEKSKRHDIAAQLKPLLHDTVSWLYTCPPFCYCEEQRAYEALEHALSEERLDRDYEEEEAHLPYLALSFCEPILRILVAIYNFCLLIRAFEKKYLRRAKRRNADAFAKAAHECFDEDDSFLILLEQMPFGGVEEFFSYPRVITGFKYFQDENDEEKWKTAQRVICRRTIDFYVFDLVNGLHHGHAPSQCQGCGRYFLTTNGHIPKYCDGVAPQDSRYTCRQYGAMMHQKEQNKQHPVYRLFNTRTDTIRKHHWRGKISDELRQEALCLAGNYRDKALMNNDYAADVICAGYGIGTHLRGGGKTAEMRKGGVPVPKNMYTVAGDGPCNEELALRIQAGDKNAAERLISQNEGYLTGLARAYTPWCETEDLKQEASAGTAGRGGAL